jgi:hypothetical protein
MTLLRARLESVEIPTSIAGFKIRKYQPGDEVGILDGFNRVFAIGNPAFRPREMRRWRWEFLENPEGTQIMVAVHEETGAIAGHFAGLPRKFAGNGREGHVAEAVDSYVDPRFRAALRRPGLFVVMALTWFREFCGDRGDFFAYGLPIDSAARIGGAFLDYQVVHQQFSLDRAIGEPRPFGGPASPAVSEVAEFDARFDELWHRIAPELGVAAVRERKYLHWRYLAHPDHQYSIGAVGDANALRGFVVSRRTWFDDRDAEVIVDFLCPRGDIEAARALLRFVSERGREHGAENLMMVMPTTSPWFLEFQRLGFVVRGTKYDFSVSHNRRPFETHTLRREWWYTLGDTDLA